MFCDKLCDDTPKWITTHIIRSLSSPTVTWALPNMLTQKHMCFLLQLFRTFINEQLSIIIISKYDDIISTKKCVNFPSHQNVTRLCTSPKYNDTITWKRFPPHWPFVRGNHRSPLYSPLKGPVMPTHVFHPKQHALGLRFDAMWFISPFKNNRQLWGLTGN